MGLLGGVLGAALAFVLLPVSENIFHFVTPTKLLELTNSDLPIFRQMAIEAPGSYHHSLIVASLAEKAAEEIGRPAAGQGRRPLPRHRQDQDAGVLHREQDRTTRRPQGHEPSLSTLVIINHVKEGIGDRQEAQAPRQVREIVEQHHGSSLVRYFYQKAKEKYDPEIQKIGEENYRYPGPCPAEQGGRPGHAGRLDRGGLAEPQGATKDNLKRVIMEIFDSYLQDGQLDNCDFSLRELRAIAASFLAMLYTIYQPRVEYPGFDFEMKKEKRARERQEEQ